jgi:hypothetical protein
MFVASIEVQSWFSYGFLRFRFSGEPHLAPKVTQAQRIQVDQASMELESVFARSMGSDVERRAVG